MDIVPLLLILSTLFFISIWIGKIGSKFGVPVLLLFLGVGMIFGSDGVGIKFDNLKVAEAIGTLSLCIILFSGGLNTKFAEVKPVIKQSLMLSTAGVLLTAFFTGIFTWWLCGEMIPALGLGIMSALLLSSCMSSTDSAAVFAILRSKNLNLKNNLAPTLELESGSNDPMAYILTITFIGLIKKGGEVHPLHIAGDIVIQIVIGALAGYLLGKLAVRVMNRIKIDNEAFYPILLLTSCIFIFSFTDFIHGNGYLSVYLGGLIIGNSKFVDKRSSIKFFEGLAWLSQILMFLTLGLLVNPDELLPIAWIGLIIGLFMIFVSRPLAVFISLLPFSTKKIKVKDRLFISWVGLRGAVPIIFAIYPLTAGVPHAKFIFNVVFFITILSLLLQGTFLGTIAKWLGLTNKSKERKKITDFDLDISEDMGSFMTEVILNNNSLRNGSMLMELPLPPEALVVLVKRDDDYFIPKGKTEMKAGDKLLIIADSQSTIDKTYSQLLI
ncbi:MAG: potassium/proton antiporter [Dysgonomonas sp.]